MLQCIVLVRLTRGRGLEERTEGKPGNFSGLGSRCWTHLEVGSQRFFPTGEWAMEFWSGTFKGGKLGKVLQARGSGRRSRRSLVLKLERLESRLVLSTATWTGTDAATNNNWS